MRRSRICICLALVVAAAGVVASAADTNTVIPDSEKNRVNPVPNVPEAIESGRVLFTSQCAMCHGPQADGRGPLVRDLNLRVPDLTRPEAQKKRTDGEWFSIISRGHGDMPAEKRLADQQKWEIIRWLRSLLKTAVAEK